MPTGQHEESGALTIRQQIFADFQLHGIVGSSPLMEAVRRRVAASTDSGLPVLITGERGTGKELVARMIHYGGSRQGQAFVPVRCGAVSGDRLELELLGSVSEALHALAEPGRSALECANGGTVYLEEVGEISAPLQAKLLHFLKRGELRVPGRKEPVRPETRIIASSTGDLARLVRRGQFHQDLYTLLRVMEITLPPLRDRADDVVELAVHFLRKRQAPGRKPPTFSRQAVLMLHTYGWPGNITQLQAALEVATAMNQSGILTPEDFPPEVNADFLRGARLGDFYTGLPSLADLGRRYLSHVLRVTGGNKSDAAAILGISRKTLYSMARRSAPTLVRTRKSRAT
jgi:DNA-binding NtrC family response regulator